MSPIYTLFVVAGIVLVAAVVTGTVIPWAKRQGVDVQDALTRTSDALAVANRTLETMKPFLTGAAADTLDQIVTAANTGVGMAEQLYHASQIATEERKAAAVDFVRDALALAGVERSPAVERLVDGAVEAAVLKL